MSFRMISKEFVAFYIDEPVTLAIGLEEPLKNIKLFLEHDEIPTPEWKDIDRLYDENLKKYVLTKTIDKELTQISPTIYTGDFVRRPFCWHVSISYESKSGNYINCVAFVKNTTKQYIEDYLFNCASKFIYSDYECKEENCNNLRISKVFSSVISKQDIAKMIVEHPTHFKITHGVALMHAFANYIPPHINNKWIAIRKKSNNEAINNLIEELHKWQEDSFMEAVKFILPPPWLKEWKFTYYPKTDRPSQEIAPWKRVSKVKTNPDANTSFGAFLHYHNISVNHH